MVAPVFYVDDGADSDDDGDDDDENVTVCILSLKDANLLQKKNLEGDEPAPKLAPPVGLKFSIAF